LRDLAPLVPEPLKHLQACIVPHVSTETYRCEMLHGPRLRSLKPPHTIHCWTIDRWLWCGLPVGNTDSSSDGSSPASRRHFRSGIHRLDQVRSLLMRGAIDRLSRHTPTEKDQHARKQDDNEYGDSHCTTLFIDHPQPPCGQPQQLALNVKKGRATPVR
ncbi:MAG: hypothetical protein ACK53L_02475, partial [Pirellulaceae bacterium]